MKLCVHMFCTQATAMIGLRRRVQLDANVSREIVNVISVIIGLWRECTRRDRVWQKACDRWFLV